MGDLDPDRDQAKVTPADAQADTNTDRCVCCGEYVPEGRQVCPLCQAAMARGMWDA